MEFHEEISRLKRATEEGRDYLLRHFEHTPEDKLNWSPAAPARTALQIVGHCGRANTAFAAGLRGDTFDLPSDPAEAAKAIRAAGNDIRSREEAVKAVEESTADVLAALDVVTPEKLETSVATPFGPIPYRMWMRIPAEHMAGHASQLAYLQTIWGDLTDHM